MANSNANTCPPQEAFDIQSPCDINQATEQDSWDGSFYPISLHGSLEHLLSDSKNIKESLCCITNYIKNKSIDCTKANNILDLNSIGEVAWNFIFTIYKSGWNALVTNKDNRTFRQQVASKFMLKIQETKKSTKGDKLTDKPVSFAKLPLLISMKTSKEVNEISKFFKKGTKLSEKKYISKSYTQASLPMTSEILKIKETFPKL